MAINTALRVDPDQLRSEVTRIQESITSITHQIQTLRQAVNGMTYWKGSAADLHKSDMQKSDEAAQAVLQRLQDYPTNIAQMAGIYDAAEEANSSIGSQLVSDIPLV